METAVCVVAVQCIFELS